MRHAARVSITSTPTRASVSARERRGCGKRCAAPVPSSTISGLVREQRGEIVFGRAPSKPAGAQPVHDGVRRQHEVLAVFGRADAHPAGPDAGDDVGRGRLQVEFHDDAGSLRPDLCIAASVADSPLGLRKSWPPPLLTSLGRFRALTPERSACPHPPATEFARLDAPAAVRLQHHDRAQDGRAPPRRGHHRLRHGQPRRPDAAAHRRQAGRDRAAPRHARLFGVARASRGCAARSATGTSGARASSSIPETEAIVTIGSKEGIAHLALATLGRGDTVLVPNPSYPIHIYGPVIAGADIRHVPMTPDVDFFAELEHAIQTSFPKPKMLIINFPSNPTAQCVELPFFEKIVALAREHGIYVVHDLAYADITFDGWKAPSIMQVPGARDVAVEFFTMSKSYNMAGWRIGFMVGNKDLVTALARIKGYHDYGTFTPIQVAAIAALEGPQDCVARNRDEVPEAARRAGQGPARGGLDGRHPEGVDVRVGEDSRAVSRSWARSSSRSSCSPRRRSRCRRASASASTATSTCASR